MQVEERKMTFKIIETIITLLVVCSLTLFNNQVLELKIDLQSEFSAPILKVLNYFNILASSTFSLILTFFIYFCETLIKNILHKGILFQVAYSFLLFFQVLVYIIEFLNISNYLGFINPGVFIFINIFLIKSIDTFSIIATRPSLALFCLYYFEISSTYKFISLIINICFIFYPLLAMSSNSIITKLVIPLFDLVSDFYELEDRVDAYLTTYIQNIFERAVFEALTDNFTNRFIDVKHNLVNYEYTS